MFKSYFKIAWRNIIRHKIYSFINILGLAFGICACITIYLITSYELGFDKFHPDVNRIYRVVGEMQSSSGENRFLNCPVVDASAIQQTIPGFETSAGFHTYDGKISIPAANGKIKKFENKIPGSYQSTSIITWPSYFSIFRHVWLTGNPASLNEPFKVVLTENRAKLYFGNIPLNSMIGKTVLYDDSLKVQVSGIVKDWQQNSDFAYTDFISIGTATHSFLKAQIPTDDWSSLRPHSAYAFVKLSKTISAGQVNKQLAALIQKHSSEFGAGNSMTSYLQPLSDLHFTSKFHRGDDGDDFRKPYLPVLYILIGVALFILSLAVVNFINLSTAQSMQRAKEIGVRKVLGSRKANIFLQFLSETLLLTTIAGSIAVLLVNPVLFLFEQYIPPGIRFQPLGSSNILFLFSITIVTTILSGFYPAKVMASYLPVQSLKGPVFHKGSDGISLRKSLIIFQFSISLVFIIGAIIIGKQVNYMSKADKGFNTDATIVVNRHRDKDHKLRLLAERTRHISGVRAVIIQDHPPMGFAQGQEDFTYGKNEPVKHSVLFDAGDENFIPFYQMKLLAGRNILHSDSLQELVINETYSKTLGFENPQDVIGKFLYKNDKPYAIAGVVADFHTGSFHETIQPVVIARMPERESSMALKLDMNANNSKAIIKIIAEMEDEWKKIFPGDPFNYSFLNDSISRLYGQEENTAWLVKAAMFITIFISCMGLFGLGMFTIERRTKEIGIRKVLGASVTDLTSMLSRDFIKLVLVAIIIASPVAWYFMNIWLQDFAYRTDISWWVFAIAGLTAVVIALMTIGFHALKAAIANPIKSLRTE